MISLKRLCLDTFLRSTITASNLCASMQLMFSSSVGVPCFTTQRNNFQSSPSYRVSQTRLNNHTRETNNSNFIQLC